MGFLSADFGTSDVLMIESDANANSLGRVSFADIIATLDICVSGDEYLIEEEEKNPTNLLLVHLASL